MKNNMKITAVTLSLILLCSICFAGCGKKAGTDTTTTSQNYNQSVTDSTFSDTAYQEQTSGTDATVSDNSQTVATEAPATDAPATEAQVTEAPATDTPATGAPATEAPVLKETVLNGTNASVLTFHTNGTYDFDCKEYYISTKDYPALKALLVMATDDVKQYIVERDGAKAVGPIHLYFNGDTYSVSGGTLALGNTKAVYVDMMGWEIDAISTVVNNGSSYTIYIKGDNGKYKFDFAEFTLNAEQAKDIGL